MERFGTDLLREKVNRGLRVRLKPSDWVTDGWRTSCKFSGKPQFCISTIFGHEKNRFHTNKGSDVFVNY
jgi:hypothetical protein